MKKIIFTIALIIPLIVFFSFKYHFDYYDNLGKQYDCYPIENCKFDINGDSKVDSVEIIDESTPNNKYNYRLKVFVDGNKSKRQILNLKYVTIDNTFRTHIAFFVENQKRKFVIYDKLNEQQYYYWNGQILAHSDNPSSKEQEVRIALGYNDDTGGFHTKIFYPFFIVPMMLIYYVLVLSVVIYFYISRKSKTTLP